MQNLTNQPLTSGSQPDSTKELEETPPNEDISTPTEPLAEPEATAPPHPYDNGNGAKPPAISEPTMDEDNPSVKPRTVSTVIAEDGTALQKPQPPIKPRPMAGVATSTPERTPTRRSLRMQIRFVRALIWAAGLLINILYWEWLVKRFMGEDFVQRRNVARWKRYARSLRNFAAEMGGVFIKAGQFISTRADIFPEEIIMELAGLQDEIPAVTFKKIEGVLQAELGGNYHDLFEWLRQEPIAAASLGQVHRAKLKNGDRVVVKVQRPGITTIIDTDLAALNVISHIAMRFKFISRRANAVEIAEEFGRVLWEEVSYYKESENANEFAQVFKDNLKVYIPTVYTEYSTDRVLVMEDVTSIKITDYERLEAAGINRTEIAHRLMDSYLSMVFDNEFFHADPHPGNLFVYPLPVEDEKADFGEGGRPFYLIYIDFGMTGRLTPQIIDGLVSTLIAVVNRDAHSLIMSYKELDLLLPGADLDRLEAATKAAFDQVWGMNMVELSSVDYEVMEKLGNEFNDLLFDMPFQMPQNFIYLARTMGILSGMCTSLDPTFNPWESLAPFAQKMMRMRARDGSSVGSSLMEGIFGSNNLLQAGTRILTQAVAPAAVNNRAIVEELRSGEIRVTSEPSRKWQIQTRFLEIQIRIVMRAVLFSGFLVSSTLLLVNGFVWVAGVGYVICFMIGWRIMFPPNILQ